MPRPPRARAAAPAAADLEVATGAAAASATDADAGSACTRAALTNFDTRNWRRSRVDVALPLDPTPSGGRRQRRLGVHSRQLAGLLHLRAHIAHHRTVAAEGRLADRLHHMLSQQPLDHRQHHRLRGVVENHHLGLGSSAEQGLGGLRAEAGGQQYGRTLLAGAHPGLGFGGGRFAQTQRGVAAQVGDDACRELALVEIGQHHGNLCRPLVAGAEQAAEEGGDEDRCHHAHQHGTAVGKMQREIFAHQRDEGVHGVGLPQSRLSRAVGGR